MMIFMFLSVACAGIFLSRSKELRYVTFNHRTLYIKFTLVVDPKSQQEQEREYVFTLNVRAIEFRFMPTLRYHDAPITLPELAPRISLAAHRSMFPQDWVPPPRNVLLPRKQFPNGSVRETAKITTINKPVEFL